MAYTYEKPTNGFKPLDALGDKYEKVLHVAYPATGHLTEEIETLIPAFVKNAKDRIELLVLLVQGLRWEIEEARKQLVEANKKLHTLLKGPINDDLSKHKEGDENKALEPSEEVRKLVDAGYQ